jgi:hypothetical protein
VVTGQLVGTVTLNDGTPAEGVMVTATSKALQGERTAATVNTGEYVLRGLPPGGYTLRFELGGLRTGTAEVVVPLGATARQDMVLVPETFEETIEVTMEAAPLETPTVGANLTSETIDELAVGRRTLSNVALLTPGVTGRTELGGQLSISGGFNYDNVFLVNGVDVNDNVFGNPDNLFIEDAIEETQVLSSGISAEYGRFGGGVINAITKSGGNEFHGSLRADLTNPSYRDETPYEVDNGIERRDDLSHFLTATLGGYIMKDRLWFFLAGRDEDLSTQRTGVRTPVAYVTQTQDARYEGKLTAQLATGHSLQASYMENDTRDTNERPLGSASTLDALVNPEYPNDLLVGRYQGVMGTSAFVEAQYSEKTFTFKNAGGTSPDFRDSPFQCVGISGGCLYNGPYFDSTDPEDRANEQGSASVSFFFDAVGTHDLKLGGERFTNIRTGGNSQSASSYTMHTNPVFDANGNIVLDAEGRAIPTFTPFTFQTYAVFWDAKRGSRTEIQTDSLYVNDIWRLNDHWSFNLGARYEKVSDENTDNVHVVDVDVLTPRLAASFDARGDGKYRFDATYGEYAGSYNMALWTNATNTGNPGYLYGPYIGPPGQGRDFAPGFDLNNYLLVLAGSPTQNVTFADDIHAPVTEEFSLSAGMQLPNAGYLKLTYQSRETKDFLEDFVTIDQGTIDIEVRGVSATTDRAVYRNSNVPVREYEALLLQGRYRINPNWSVEGHWTHQLRNHGNYEGEAGQTIGPSGFGDYPELFSQARNFPTGRLDDYQEDLVRLWTIYDLSLGRAGRVGVSLLGTYNSPITHNFSRTNVRLTAAQAARDPGYAQPPSTQTIFFGERGAGEFSDWYTFDFAANYRLPFLKRLAPYMKLEVYNLLNDDTLMTHDTTINPVFRNAANPSAPVDELGLPTTFTRASSFGNARNAADYVTPREYRFSAGITF